MKRKLTVIIAITVVVASLATVSFFLWRTNNELKAVREQNEISIPIIALSQTFQGATLEGLTKAEVYIAQVNIPGASVHLAVYIGGKWFDIGEGYINAHQLPVADNTTGE